MTEEANKIDWQETDSVLEAIILESEFDKKYISRNIIPKKSR